MKIDFTPPPTIKKFMLSDAKMRVIMGPVGSGKSVGCSFEVVRRASQQKPDQTGIRRTRFAVVRETARQLQDTTIKTFLDWFPPGTCGNFMRTTKTYFFKLGNVESEIMFRALDDADDVANLNSLELTGAWFNECRDIHPDIMDAMSKRIGRFPSKKDGGPTWYGMWGDTNPPRMDSWWYFQMEHLDPKDGVSPNDNGWEVFKQPSGRSAYAENIENLPEGYYDTQGRSGEYIRTFIDGEYGHSGAGTPVFKYFNPDYHIAKSPIRPIVNGVRPVVVGMDLGLCYSDDTEVLTADGWKFFRDVDEAVDTVATLNPNGFGFEYTPINFKVEYDYDGELVQFKGQNFDFLVTPEHRTPFTYRDTPNRLHFTSAEELSTKTTAHRYIQTACSDWVGKTYSLLGLPEDISMAFWGWYLSEGSCYRKGNSYRITVSQEKDSVELANLMRRSEWEDLGITWYPVKTGWRCSSRVLGELVYPTGKARGKYIPQQILQASASGLRIFLDAFIAGDGHIRTKARKNNGTGRKARNEVTAFTTSPYLRDGLMEVAAKLGLTPCAREETGSWSAMPDGRRIAPSAGWSISFKSIKRAEILPHHVSRVPYKGKIYCLNVPYHTLYVRRNGRPCWNGNTPAAVLGQQDARGRAIILDDLVSTDMGAKRFIREKLKPLLYERYPGCPLLVVVDPAGVQRAQTDERSVVDIIKGEGLRVIPAKTNRITARINAVDDYLMRQVDGDPAFLMDRRCSHLKAALMGGYRYKKNDQDSIEKNKHSHVAEALQYLMLHIAAVGDGAASLVGQRREIKQVATAGWT